MNLNGFARGVHINEYSYPSCLLLSFNTLYGMLMSVIKCYHLYFKQEDQSLE